MLSFEEMKERAKSSMSTATIHPILVFLVYIGINMAISFVVQIATSIITSVGMLPYMIAIESENVPMIIGSFLILLLLIIVLSMAMSIPIYAILTGYQGYTLKVIRNQITSVNNLFDYLKKCWKIFCLYFMVGLFVWAWSLLLIVPGIMAAYSYSMALYIFIDDPEKPVMQCLRESKQMMAGHRMELFQLQLSFILWWLGYLCTCGLLGIYFVPYMSLTMSIYYDNLTYVTGMRSPKADQAAKNIPPQQNNQWNNGYGQQPQNNQWNQGYNQQPQNNQWNNGYGQQPQNNQWNNGYGQQPQNNQWNNGYSQQPQNSQWNNGYSQQPQNDQWNNGSSQQPQNDQWNHANDQQSQNDSWNQK